MKTQTAEEILNKYDKIFYENGRRSTGTAIDFNDVLLAMKEYAEQALDLAAEQAVCLRENYWDDHLEVDKDSILSLKSKLS